MRLAVFRADQDGRRTARRLATCGHEAVLAPVIAVVPTGIAMPVQDIDVVVFTSQHAAAALRTDDVRLLSTLPCFCVGTRTAHAAAAAGFSDVRSTDGDAATLAAAIGQAFRPGARVVFAAGRDRKPDLEHALMQKGFVVRLAEVYRAEPATPWRSATISALQSCDGALHYSRRTASLACGQARNGGLAACLSDWTHFCLSEDIARQLRADAAKDVRVASTPDESALMALLGTSASARLVE